VSKRTFTVLTIVFTATCAFLFNIFYKEAKSTAITKLNEEQMIHAEQAARGIEDFFAMWTRDLNSFSKMDEIIDTDAVGKRHMKLFYEAHQEQITSITRLDERGVILYNFPLSSSVGTDISDQEHVRELLRDHKPVISDVFRAVEGFDAVALHVPIFRGSVFKGSIGILINFEILAKRYLDVIKIGETGYAWVVSRDGTQLYSPISGFNGKSVFETIKDSPSLTAMVTDMLKGHEGTATYTVDRIVDQSARHIREYAVFMPVHVGSTFWSIAVASAEQDVLSGLISFRNKLAFVIGALFICAMMFSTLGAKAWFIVKEEEKRKQTEKKLQASEQIAEKFSTLFHAAPFAMSLATTPDGVLYDVNQAWLDLAGFTRKEEVIGKSDVELEIIRGAEPRERILSEFRQRGSVRNAEISTHTKAGVQFALLVNLDGVDIGGRKFLLSSMQDITERKNAEEALHRSEKQYRGLFENMIEGFAFCKMIFENGKPQDFIYLTVNHAFENLTGLKDVVGKRITEVIPGIRDADPELFEIYGKVSLNGKPERFEIFVEALKMWFSISVYSPEKEFFVAVFDVITERKKAEEVQGRLAAIVESADDAIIGEDLNGIVQTWNMGAEIIFGYKAKEIIGKPISLLVPAGHTDELPEIFARIKQGEHIENFETIRMRKDGTIIPVSLTFSAIKDANGKVIGASKIAHDITERKKAEDAIFELNATLQRNNAQLAAANKELESFNYSVSHDLRSPLRSLYGFSQALLEGYADKLDAEGQDHLLRIRAASQRMGQLIDDLLSLSRVSRGEMTRENMDLSAMACGIAEELRATAPQRGADFVISQGLLAYADPRLLRIVLNNLLGNAWKFTSNRPDARIEFGCKEETGGKSYFVRDNGVGFDMAYAGKLFGAFQRLHAMDEFPGTGIGLATVQRIVHRHGGRIWAESALGKGATFYFTL
jgi:PAS domain S-box-containing protein